MSDDVMECTKFANGIYTDVWVSMGEPEELCGTIQYLISDASKFVTGTVAVVDGGFNIFAM